MKSKFKLMQKISSSPARYADNENKKLLTLFAIKGVGNFKHDGDRNFLSEPI